jgi:polyhydroxybutyrate depolymerase
VLLIHGTDDPLVPFSGGAVGFSKNSGHDAVWSVDATRDFWLRVDGLQNVQPLNYVFPHAGNDATRASKATWGTDTGPQVQVITIENGGHAVPSTHFHYRPLYSLIVGLQNRDLEAAEEAWTFFRNKTSQ